ncbi:MAG TPA: hypothetical protein VKU00_04260, partial [Chthonomonadaceae bacterium]|nr:hypothetical protein [Chthonomonadaceae bacterium]
LLVASVWHTRRLPWRGLLTFAALLAPWLLYATLTFGSPVPVSLQAKLIVYGRLAGPGFPYLRPFLELMLHNPLGALLGLGVLLYPVALYITRFAPERANPQGEAGRGAASSAPTGDADPMAVQNRKGREGLLLAPLAWLLLYYGSMALSKVFLFGWYFVPPTPIYYLVALTGWSLTLGLLGRAGVGAWEQLQARLAESAAMSAMVTLLAGIALSLLIVPRVVATLKVGQSEEESLRVPIGLWLRDHSAPGDNVMLEPIGYIGYYSRLPVVDMVGLVSPEVLPCYDRRNPSPYHTMWTQVQPAWILWRTGQLKELRDYEATLLAGERMEAHYTQVKVWPEGTGNSREPAIFTLFRRNP